MITSLLNDVITTVSMQNSRHRLEIVFDMNPKIPAVLIGDVEKISHVHSTDLVLLALHQLQTIA